MTKQSGGAVRRFGSGGEVFVMTILAGLISTAYAQTEPPPAPATATTQTQTQKQSTNSEAIAKSPADKAVVTVSGFRSSLGLSAMEKRDNIGLSDTVFSEDMGKFPDPNIADALARVPGVTVRRAEIDGEGLNISIRGMGPAFTHVLLNNAPMASASAGSWGGSISANREVDMDFLPSELFLSLIHISEPTRPY